MGCRCPNRLHTPRTLASPLEPRERLSPIRVVGRRRATYGDRINQFKGTCLPAFPVGPRGDCRKNCHRIPGSKVKVGDAIKMVESDGWELTRTRGSHRQYHHPVKPGTVTIAGHPSLDLDPKTQSSILKQAGLK
jgi:predicted RNA binding protein YcfA (HicA-like mRNA interferase family)